MSNNTDKRTWEVFLAGGISGAATVTAALMLSWGSNTVNAIVVGGIGAATGAGIISAQSTKELKSLQEKNELLNEVSVNLVKRDELIVKLESLEEQIKTAEAERRELAKLRGEYEALKSQQAKLDQEIKALQENKQDLERRVEVINQTNPQLDRLEELQKNIEQSRLNLSALEGKITASEQQLAELEQNSLKLQEITIELLQKELALREVKNQLESTQNCLSNLEDRTAELEFLRVTYDALFAEREQLEAKIAILRPELERLETERQRIVQAIQEDSQKYQQLEVLRQELENINVQLRTKSGKVRSLERETEQLEANKTLLEGDKHTLETRNRELEQKIKELKGEISEIEGSAQIALQGLRNRIWTRIPTASRQPEQELQFLAKFQQYLQRQGLSFPERIVNAFHTSLKVQDISALVILAGISGTGKSELPRQYAEFIGAQFLMLPVQPRWDSPQDLQGFYNYIEKKYKPTDLMRGLYQYNHDQKMQGRIVIVLLDEMNLARVEYYFSDFLSKLETRRSRETFLDLDVGSLPLPESEKRVKIPEQFLFVGTMNEDETTQSLSDKVLDRANVLTFGKPTELKLRGTQIIQQDLVGESYISYQDFHKHWGRKPEHYPVVMERVKEFVYAANNIMADLGHPFAHRVYQAIAKYVVNYPGVEAGNEAINWAIADQFGQKLLPKLRGTMVEEAQENLDEMERLINQLNDNPLTQAFEKARKGRYGQFHWGGLVY